MRGGPHGVRAVQPATRKALQATAEVQRRPLPRSVATAADRRASPDSVRSLAQNRIGTTLGNGPVNMQKLCRNFSTKVSESR